MRGRQRQCTALETRRKRINTSIMMIESTHSTQSANGRRHSGQGCVKEPEDVQDKTEVEGSGRICGMQLRGQEIENEITPSALWVQSLVLTLT